jgi:hypothetical protein
MRKMVTRVRGRLRNGIQICRVCQLVDVDNRRFGLPKQMSNYRRADEPRSARDENRRVLELHMPTCAGESPLRSVSLDAILTPSDPWQFLTYSRQAIPMLTYAA